MKVIVCYGTKKARNFHHRVTWFNPTMKQSNSCKTWGFHSGEDSSWSHLHPEDGSSMDIWNIGIIPQNYTAS